MIYQKNITDCQWETIDEITGSEEYIRISVNSETATDEDSSSFSPTDSLGTNCMYELDEVIIDADISHLTVWFYYTRK